MPHAVPPNKLLLSLAIAACALAGCQRAADAVAERAAERAIEQASGKKVDIDRDGQTVSIKTDQGEMKIATAGDGESVALPADFPTDVYLPDQRTVSTAMDMGGIKAVNLATRHALAKVSADVEKTMQGQGWKREMSMQSGTDSSTLIYSKDNRQAVYQLIKDNDGGTQVAVRIGNGS